MEQNSWKWNPKSIVMAIVGGFLIVGLLLYYIVVCLWQRELTMQDDLRRLGARRQATKLGLWKSQKTKGY